MIRSTSARLIRRVACQLAAGLTAILASTISATAQQTPTVVKIVSEDGCPLELQNATLGAWPEGVSITFVIRNSGNDLVKDVMITAAAVNAEGDVLSLDMQPVNKKIGARRSQRFTVLFPGLKLTDAEVVTIGVQGVRWFSGRPEWRATLRVSGPVGLAAKR